MVLEGIASSLLSHFLAKYIDKLNGNDLKVSLFSGKVSLDNLSIKPSALMEHQLPFEVVRGLIQQISLSIPYTKLKSKPCIATVSDILILGKMCGKVLIQSDTQASNLLAEYGELDSALSDQNVSKGDFMSGIAGTIIDNLQVNVTNIHVRLEYNINGHLVAIGAFIPLIKVCTIDENDKEININTSKTMLRKKLTLQGLSLYVDTQCERLDVSTNDKFQKAMLESMKDMTHQFVLHDFSFNVIYEHPKAGSNNIYGNIISITTSAVNLALDAMQYRCFNELQIEQSRFARRRFYAICGRPDQYPEDEDSIGISLWWQFVCKSSYKKTHPITFNPKNALDFLKNRKKYLSRLSTILTKPNPKKDEAYLKDLQQKHGGDVFLLFRSYAKAITERELKEIALKKSPAKSIDIKSNELQEIVSQKDSITNNADKLLVNFSIQDINVGLAYNPKTPLALLQLTAWKGRMEKNKDDLNIEAQIGDMLLINRRGKGDNINIVKLNKSELTKGNCALLNISGNLEKQLFNIDFNAASPEFYADFNMFADVKTFFSSASDLSFEESAPVAKKRDMTVPEIQNVIEAHKTMFLKVHFESPVLKIPYKMPIDISIGNIDIATVNSDRSRSIDDEESWYDEFSLDINGFKISMNNDLLCEPININLLLAQSFVRKETIAMTKVSTSISSIIVNIQHDHYISLLQFPEIFEQLNGPPPPAQLAIENASTNSNIVAVPKASKPIDSAASGLSIAFDFKFKEFHLALVNSDKSIGSDVRINGISATFKAVQGNIDAMFVLQFLKVNGPQQNICNFGSNDEAAVSIIAALRGICVDLQLTTASPVVTVDVNWLKDIMDFFIPPPSPVAAEPLPPPPKQRRMSTLSVTKSTVFGERRDYNDFQLIKQLKEHPIMKININTGAPKIIIPSESPLVVSLGSFKITTMELIERSPTNINSFYDRFEIEFSELNIKFGDEFILDPFSTKIEISKAFIVRKDVQAMKVKLDINSLKAQLKQSQFHKLLGVADSFSVLSPKPTDAPALPAPAKVEMIDKIETDSPSVGLENMVMNSDNSFSILADVSFKQLQISLINEDDSVHSCFEMAHMGCHVDTLQNNIDASFHINKLSAISDDKVILSFGDKDVKSMDFSYKLTNDVHNVNCMISKPTLNVDFRWIFQLQQFFTIPKKPEVYIPTKSTNQADNDEYEYAERNIELTQPEEKKPLPKFIVNFCIDHPSIKIILVGKNKEPIELRAGLGEIKANINEDQTGYFLISDFQIAVNERYLMSPFTIDVKLQLQPTIKVTLGLDDIVLKLQTTDYQLLLEIGEYIPAVLFEAQKENQPRKTPKVEVVGEEEISHLNVVERGITLDEEFNDDENDQVESTPPELDIKINKVGVELLEKEKRLFNFDINKIMVSTGSDGQISVSVASVICQEHVSSASNDLVTFPTPTIVNIDGNGNVNVIISQDGALFVKMEAVQALLSIFAPKDQILDYTKPKKKKQPPPPPPKKGNKPSKPSKSTINVNGKSFRVAILDETEILTVLVNDLSFKSDGLNQNIIINTIAITDPNKSDLYPSDILRNETDKAVDILISDNQTIVNVNALTIFAHFGAVKRVLDVISNYPLDIPKSNEDEDENDISSVEETNNDDEIMLQNTQKSLLKICLNKAKVTVPVAFDKSNEMLEFCIDAAIMIQDAIKVDLKSFTARFTQYKGIEHPPFINNLCFNMTYALNVIELATIPSAITFAPADVAAINVLVDSLLQFINSLTLPKLGNETEKDKIPTKKPAEKASPSALIKIEANSLTIKMNSDRYHTVPLFRFQITKVIVDSAMIGGTNKTNAEVYFNSIDFMDTAHMDWKMLIEPFALGCRLHASEENTKVLVDVLEPISVNCSYNAIQLILKHAKNISYVISTKELIDNEPPLFKIKNISAEKVKVHTDRGNEIIDPLSVREFNFTRDSEIPITIGGRSINIKANQLPYPIFFNEHTVVSQNRDESGTTLTIAPIILFKNTTEYTLHLLKQKKMRSYSHVIEIPSGKSIAIPTNEQVRGTNFTFTSNGDATNISHSTFEIKTIKRRSILLECLVDHGHKMKFVVSSRFDPLTCSLIVKIEPNCIICNQLPVDLILRVAGQNVRYFIKEGGKKKASTIDASSGSFNAHFATGTFSKHDENKTPSSQMNLHNQPIKLSKRVPVNTKDGALSEIELTFVTDSFEAIDNSSIVKIAVEAKTNPKKPQTTLVFYSPSIIFNRSGYDIIAACFVNQKMTYLGKFAPREKGADPNEDGYVLWSSQEFFKKKESERKLPLNIMSSNEDGLMISEDVIECTGTHVDGPLMIPTKNPDLFVPLHYTVSSNEPYSHSTIITITSQCRVCNEMSCSVFIQPVIDEDKFGDPIEIEANITHLVRLATVNLLYAFRLSKDSEKFVILNFSEPIHTTFCIDNVYIEIENQALGVEMLITLKKAIIPQPIMLLNDLEDEEVIIAQKGAKYLECIAPPQATSIVAYEIPFGGTDIVLKYKGEEITVDLVRVNTPQQHGDIYFEVVVNNNNTKSVTVSRKPIEHEKPKELEFSANIPVISVTLIDKIDREFALLTLQKLQFSFSTGELTSIAFRLNAFQLDDLHPTAMLRVVGAGYPDVPEGEPADSRNLIDFSVSMFPNAPMFTACKDITFTIEPMILFVDLSFISDMIFLMQNMFISKEASASLLSKPEPVKPSKLSSIPLSAENLTINEIALTIFVRSKSTRPTLYPMLSSFLNAVPEITNGKIVLPSFHFEDCTMNAAYIQKEIIKPLINAAIMQGMKMLFNTDIFMRSTGTKSASFAKRGERLVNGELQVLVQVPGSLILQGGESVVNVASKLVHFVSFDGSAGVNRVNTTAKETMQGGLKAAGEGFIEGITGIITTPMQMCEEQGVGGAIVGVGKGLLGLVTKPVAGILDAGVASFAAMRKVISGEDADVIPPIRVAHALPMMALPNYTNEMFAMKDVAQYSFQRSDKKKFMELVEMYLVDSESGKWYGVTQNYVFQASELGEVKSSWKIRNIIEAKSNQNAVSFKIKEITLKEIKIVAKSPRDSYVFEQLINSRKVTLGIGE
ncbi:hypothetical protein TRFO_01673 [Tritrichomonas foetus]|uniref:Chorein N-terminal domain-containing protein n=1 Tax=Tritrichomonas foetus TaxID=1144522 RepID=A0A1J4JPR3_9EUKA|nr:hypothetical protein TRFO_01673 [Tritrichomonas foetus]|eukprot:OHT01097.1 hypothetical protein TRFO_01673 [Tritrichomonas foetus]